MINIGVLNTNTPQQNAGLFFGEFNMTGWDANQKLVQGAGGMFGVLVANFAIMNYNFDFLEGIDGNILDQDMKGQVSGNV